MCERRYTDATIAELQRVAAFVELRRRIRERQERMNYPNRGVMAAGIDAGLQVALSLMDEMEQRCDVAHELTQ